MPTYISGKRSVNRELIVALGETKSGAGKHGQEAGAQQNAENRPRRAWLNRGFPPCPDKRSLGFHKATGDSGDWRRERGRSGVRGEIVCK